MSIRVTVADASGVRALDADAFPAALGGAMSVMALPDLESGPAAAWLGVAGGHVFVQPAAGGPAVLHEGVRVERSTWLRDGNRLEIGGVAVACTVTADGVRLALADPAGPPSVLPPPVPPPSGPPLAPAARPSARPGSRPVPRPGRPGRGLRITVWAAFAALALAGVYVFTATPVSIAVSPEPDRVAVEGPFPSIVLGGRRLMVPGVYTLIAEREGHHRLVERIDVESGRRMDLAYALRRLPGRLSFDLQPAAGVSVSVDGEPAGSTPLEALDLEAGPHEVVLARERYRTLRRVIEVEGLGREQTFEAALEPLWAPVTIESVPPGAAIVRGDEVLGATPLTVDLLEGEHLLVARAERHDALEFAVAVAAQVPLAVPVLVLRESDAVVELTTRPTGASVQVDGHFAGRSPLSVALRPGEPHRLVASLAGHAKVERTLSVEAAEERELSLDLPRLFGTVFVVATPADAELFVDGVSRGPANQRLRLAAVAHEIEVRREGFEPYRASVTPRPGASLEVRAVLRSGAEARAARNPPLLTTGAGQRLALVRPQGRFMMGASRREQGARANEYQRLVELTKPYYIGLYEVTGAQFRAFRPGHRAGLAGSHSLDGDRQPVVSVTWNDAVEYLNWLSAKDGLAPAYVRQGESYSLVSPATGGYRLPTEAEWAYVARFSGGREDRFPWPGGFPPGALSGNYADQSAASLLPNTLADYDDGNPVGAPIGSFPAGPSGLFDLGGNVAEWTGDYYAVYPDAADRLVSDPRGPETGKHRVVRGSSWRHWSISELRLSYRDYSGEARHDLGFRIARSVQ